MFPRVTNATPRRGMASKRQTSTGNRTSTARSVGIRSVKDVSYFKGKVHSKTTELRIELYRIQQETDALQLQETAICINREKAQTLAEELTTKQALLTDLNIAIEKVNIGCTLSKLQNELSELKNNNDRIEEEQEMLYANRIDQQKKISEINLVISTLLQGQAILTSSDYEAVKSNPRKLELAKLELQMSHLENQKTLLQYELNIPKMGDPEEEIAMLSGQLASLVVKKLRNISRRLKSFPKQEQYEKFLAKNMSDFAHEDTTPMRLLIDLGLYLEQIKMIDRNMDVSMRKFRDKTMDLKGIWSNSLNSSDLENTVCRKRSTLINQKTNLECRNHSSKMALDTRSAELDSYQRQLMKSKDYSKLCDLELKLSNCRRINHDLEEYLEEGKSLQDWQECKERTMCVVNRLNEKLLKKNAVIALLF